MTGLVDAVNAGRLEGLCALRDLLAEALTDPSVPLYSIAGLARELSKVLGDIESLKPDESGPDFVERLAMQRASRRSLSARQRA